MDNIHESTPSSAVEVSKIEKGSGGLLSKILSGKGLNILAAGGIFAAVAAGVGAVAGKVKQFTAFLVDLANQGLKTSAVFDDLNKL